MHDNSVSLYPNPVKNTNTLDVSKHTSLIGSQAQLTDAGGRLLKSFSINSNQQQLNLANYPAGLYFLKLDDGSVIKLFKQ